MLPGGGREAAAGEEEEEEVLPFSETDTVKVFVRARPINEREVEMGASIAKSPPPFPPFL